MKVKMFPYPDHVKGVSGIDQVVLAYAKHLPAHGIEIVPLESESFDLVAGHVGAGATLEHPFVCHVHGLHWTADYHCERWQYHVNAQVVDAIRKANEITVPSAWVAETFQRDLRLTPHIIPHGIDVADWTHNEPQGDYVLYNKNRQGDVCDASPVLALAQKLRQYKFLTTFAPVRAPAMSNVKVLNGVVPHNKMKKLVQSCLVYLSVVKETFSIGVLEAMAAGRPVLGFDFGGNSFLVEHGVNGYLAKPGDIDDLVNGLEYCVKYRKTLGENGRELAKKWTWQAACEMVARVYERALSPEPPTVGVVIPCYNLADTLERTIESVCKQTWLENTKENRRQQIIVVDDGSKPEQLERITRTVQELSSRYPFINIGLVRQTNRGVATARNRGIAETDSKYICCLDADDAIAPEFIERCVRELEADRSLGIAYTGLHYIKPDGTQGLSQWPGEWSFDKHLQRQNQVPTCAVYRRELWERLGGYRSRYCPSGAGEEDAEYYLRAGAYGYKARKVTNKGLFIYSWQSGQVSGNKNHKVTNWTEYHPWCEDELHPFASYASPKTENGKQLLSHPVRQYDKPVVSVVIPVGPGHEEQVVNALDSLEAQTFRNWEAVVVWDIYSEPSSDSPLPWSLEKLLNTYPYVRLVDLTHHSGNNAVAYLDKSLRIEGSKGASYARNRGAEIARAPFLLWLDADDWLYPKALEKMLEAWNQHQSIIYTDFTARTICDDKYKNKVASQGRLLAHLKTWKNENDENLNLIVHQDQLPDYNCELAQQQPKLDAAGKPYLWCNVTALVPRAWHEEVNGFDESMPSWEDLDYHWRLAKSGKCYHRIPEELMVYNFHHGKRREKGRQNHENLIQYLIEKHKGIEAMGCRGCGRRKSVPRAGAFSTIDSRRSAPASDAIMVADDDFVRCRYMSRNTGNHKLVGAFLFDRRLEAMPGPLSMQRKNRNPDYWSIDYGYVSGGSAMLIHKEDIKAMPQLFVPIEEEVVHDIPEPVREPVTEPELIDQPTIEEQIQGLSSSERAKLLAKLGAGAATEVVNMPEPQRMSAIDVGELSMPESTGVVSDILDNVEPEAPDIPREPAFKLQMIAGITGNIAKQLEQDGLTTREDLLELSTEDWMKYKGVAQRRAAMIMRALNQ